MKNFIEGFYLIFIIFYFCSTLYVGVLLVEDTSLARWRPPEFISYFILTPIFLVFSIWFFGSLAGFLTALTVDILLTVFGCKKEEDMFFNTSKFIREYSLRSWF